MTSFGKSLRQQRELRSVALEDIAQATMINLRYLQAIEEEDFSHLPHCTFVKGFLRAYAKYLGLDADEVVLSYEHLLLEKEGEEIETSARKPVNEPPPEQPVENTTHKTDKGKKSFFSFPAWCWLLAILFFGVLFFFLWRGKGENIMSVARDKKKLIKRSSEKGAGKTTLPDSDKKKAVTSNKKPSLKASTTNTTTRLTNKGANSNKNKPLVEKETTIPATAKPNDPEKTVQHTQLEKKNTLVPEKKGLFLDISAAEDSWVLVEIDDIDSQDFFIRSGTSRSIRAKERIVFRTIGNAGGLSFRYKGKTLPLSAKSGKVLHDIVVLKDMDIEVLRKSLNVQ